VPTHGPRANATYISSLGDNVLTQRGHVRVRSTMELVLHPGVFAIGDIIDWPEQKQAAKVTGHVAVAVPNVISFLEGKTPKKKYKGATEIIVLPVGKNGGAAYLGILWGITFGDWFVRWLKKDLFIGKTRADRGL